VVPTLILRNRRVSGGFSAPLFIKGSCTIPATIGRASPLVKTNPAAVTLRSGTDSHSVHAAFVLSAAGQHKTPRPDNGHGVRRAKKGSQSESSPEKAASLSGFLTM
jgi:hypothetical protein